MKKSIYNLKSKVIPYPEITEYIIGVNIISNLDHCSVIKRSNYSCFLLIIDDVVDRYFGKVIKKSLMKLGKPIIISKIKSVEQNKDLSTIPKAVKPFFNYGFDKNACLIAIGGGIITDLGGFIGSILLRGIDFIFLPTTFLSQVDAAIGGKVAVNLRINDRLMYKNMLGKFQQPKAVITDVNVLKTLPVKEIKSGLGETFKYFIAFSKPGIDNLLELSKSKKFDKDLLGEIIYECQKIKKNIIEKDPYEKLEMRVKLNLGHTFAHGIEAVSNNISHGEAVSIGIVAASSLSLQLGLLSKNTYQMIIDYVQQLSLPSCISNVNINDVFHAMKMDKKGGSFVLIRDIGRLETGVIPKKNLIKKALEKIID